jgi:quinol monooxygenase YgiN
VLLVIGTFRLAAGRLADARPAMRAMSEASRAEDGCIDYGYAEDVLEPGLIHVREIWRDQPSLDRHLASPHLAQWRSTWTALGIGARDLRRHELGEGVVT